MKTSYLYDAANRVSEIMYAVQYCEGGNPRKIVNVAYDQTSRLSSISVNGSVQSDSRRKPDRARGLNGLTTHGAERLLFVSIRRREARRQWVGRRRMFMRVRVCYRLQPITTLFQKHRIEALTLI